MAKKIDSTFIDDEMTTDAELGAASVEDRKRENHTGTQTSSTISDFTTAVQTIAQQEIQSATLNANQIADGTISNQEYQTLNGIDTNTTIQSQLNALDSADDALDLRVDALELISVDTKEPTGFLDRTSSTISFSNSTRELSIAPVSGSFSIYIKGQKISISTTLTKQIPNTSGNYFFYINASGVLDYSTTFDVSLLSDYAYAAYLYWSATDGAFVSLGEERHGITMDATTHGYLHTTRGTQLVSGASISYTIGNGNSNADAQISLSDMQIKDEDITVNIVNNASPSQPFQQILSPIARIPIYYRQGTTEWRKQPATDYPIWLATNRCYYNESVGGVWQLTEAPANNRVCVSYIFATTNIEEPVICLLGQAEYQNVDQAKELAAWDQISFGDLPAQELKLLYILYYETSATHTNAVKSNIVYVGDVRFTYDRQVSSTVFNGNHSNLSGLGSDDHLQYHNDTRGDARYYTKGEIDTQVTGLDTRIDTLESNAPDPDFKFINSKSDLPAPVGGVITLAAGVTYFITKTIDLTGDRLVAGNNTTIIGGSSENCFLISTGLDASTALITSNWSLPMRHISITHGTAVNLDATGNSTAALDWLGVNFTNCATVGTIKTYSNFIMSDCALLSSANMTFDGTIGTVGFVNCLFSGIAAQTTLNFPSTLTITRRIRAIYSSFVAFGGATAIFVDPNAIVPVESYILDTINFSGGATYTGGVTYTDNKAFFSNCKGIVNSSEIGQAYYTNNTVQNPITTQNVFEKILGVTTASPINQKFSHTDNRLTYTGGLVRSFKITAAISANSVTTQSIIIKTRVAKNGTTIAESESQATTSATGRNENFFSQAIVELNTNDFIEIFIANETNANNVLVTELNFIVEALN